MGSHGYIVTCPNCKKDMDKTNFTKPTSYTISMCLQCGFFTETDIGFKDLKALNREREEYNEIYEFSKGDKGYLKPLKKLPKQNKELC